MLRAAHPFSLIILGASGHLARMKLYPALYFLALKKRLPERYSIVGFSRTPMTDGAFRALVATAIRAHVPEVNEGVLAECLEHCFYHAGQYDAVEDFRALASRLDELERGSSDGIRLAYLSIPPSVFRSTIHHLCSGGVHRDPGRFRCIVEKPVGTNLASFEELTTVLARCFRPEEIYFLDHYLGKEAVRNVYYLRHANPVIERLMKNTLITHVQITATETAGLEGRAGYFQAVGTLRDMFQSHLLQIAALLTMRLVSDVRDLKAARLEAIRKFYLPPSADLSGVVTQGQYDAGMIGSMTVPAYRSEENVPADARTPTEAALRLLSRSSRWEGVPLFLHSGKRLARKETRIAIEFHDAATLIGKNEHRNRLEIILQGEAGMRLTLQTKLGGSEPQFRPLIVEDPLVCMGDCLVEHSLLLLEAVNGVQDWFLHPDEIRAAWQLIDPLQAYLDGPETPLALYPAGIPVPDHTQRFLATFGHAWF